MNYRDRVTIVHPAQAVGQYGTVTYDYVNGTSEVVSASVQPQLSEETVDLQIDADRWRLFCAPGTDLTVVDRVEWGGMSLAVDGRVEDWSASRVPHLECPLREVPEDTLARERLETALELTDLCTIRRHVPQVQDDQGRWVEAFTTVYEGPCRVEPQTSTRITSEPHRGLDERRYEVRLPWTVTVPVQVADILTVTVSDDTWVIGRDLTVIGVGYGSGSFRQLLVEDLP